MIHLAVTVDAAADLSTYGAGALLRWESSDSITGTYVEGGTQALVSGTNTYDIFDSAGDYLTWYRTRISDSGGTIFSEYSDPFQSASHQYLTVDEFLAFVPSDLSVSSLQLLLDAAAGEIDEILGPITSVSDTDPLGTVNELIRAHGDLILLSRRAAAVIEVVEGTTTLDATDYELKSGGTILRRVHASTATHPSYRWHHLVDVTYVFDDLAARRRVQLALVQLDLNHQPGSSQETIGSWSESSSQDSAWNYETERKAILATLVPSPAMIF